MAEDEEQLEKTPEQKDVVPKLIEAEMKESFLDYAMSVIVSRALPDVRDGLKPVHRRVLFSMRDLGLLHNKSYKKSARIVGDCMGKYHPHGDVAIYDTLVRMAQDFSLRYPLVDGQGNFGSIDGDPPAAMRYTEARMARLAEEMLIDIEKETVNFVDNYDAHLKEPSVLPSRIPNLLVNGSTGIAVGMATNIPPHNLNEVADATIALIDDPDMDVNALNKVIKGPDFPTAGIICGVNGIRNAYGLGRGRIIVKSKTHVEERKGKEMIIVTEIPFQVNKSQLIEQIADQVKAGRIEGVSDIRDESNKEGIRIVFVLKGTVGSDVVLNQLFKHSRLRTTFGTNMLALVNNEPKTLNLKQLLQHFINHRKEVVTRKTEFELKEAKAKAHKLEGLKIALDNIDPVIALIKKAPDAKTATGELMSQYSLSEIQAKTILEMRLQRLTALEQDKIKIDLKETLELIEKLTIILNDEKLVYSIIKEETLELKEKYGDARRTEISFEEEEELEDEALIEEERMVVTVTHSGYVKRLPLTTYRMQRRGGVGVKGAGTKEEDFVENLFIASTHAYLLCFTNAGNMHWLKVYQIPESSRQARGKAIVNLVQPKKGEKITTIIPVRSFDPDKYLIAVTKKGVVKKTDLAAYSKPRKGGLRAIKLDADDELMDVKVTSGIDDIVIASADGMAVRFHEKQARAIGRASRGVRGISLRGGDHVVGLLVCQLGTDVFSITKNGYGKRTPIGQYRRTNRGGVGVINIKTSERNGPIVSVLAVTDKNDIMFITKNGIVIRVAASGISRIGRNTQGMRLMKLRPGDAVVSAARVIKEEEEAEITEKNGNGGNNMVTFRKKEKESEELEEHPDIIEPTDEALKDDELAPNEEAMVRGLESDASETINKEILEGDSYQVVSDEEIEPKKKDEEEE
ncbi:MAG: DNA gyrase subunit A [Nanoarchaeota archaeon]|nr:DNA gyrase subunit A [Nanoarchaeota archaeon]